MPLPSWLDTGLQAVGSVAALPLNVLGALAHGALGNGSDPAQWKHPDRLALAQSYLPDGLADADKAQRLETFRQIPLQSWPMLIRQFQKQDTLAAELHASPEYQDLYRQGGPEAVQQRFPGVPLPPSKPITVTDYPPLDDLDHAIAQAGGTANVPLPLPLRGSVPSFPPQHPEKTVKYETAKTQLAATQRPGAQGRIAGAALAEVPPELEDVAAMMDQAGQLAAERGYLPEFSADKGGFGMKFTRPGAEAEARTRGQKRGEYTRLGGGGAPAAAGAPRKPGGTVGTPTPAGTFYDLGNGQYADPQGNIVDQLPTGAATTPATVEPAAEPMRGQASLSLGNYPDATAADFQLLEQRQQNALKLDYEEQVEAMKAKIKGKQLNENERTKLAKIAAARSFLNVFERYGLEGQKGDPQTGAETFASTLPDKRISGLEAGGELLRQSGPVQTLARDPFLQGFRRYQSIARPIIARNLGDDTGNLSETEQAAAAAMTKAVSKPELRDAVAQMRAIIDEREAALLVGKDGGKPTSEKTPDAQRTPTPEEARAELRARGVPGY